MSELLQNYETTVQPSVAEAYFADLTDGMTTSLQAGEEQSRRISETSGRSAMLTNAVEASGFEVSTTKEDALKVLDGLEYQQSSLNERAQQIQDDSTVINEQNREACHSLRELWEKIESTIAQTDNLMARRAEIENGISKIERSITAHGSNERQLLRKIEAVRQNLAGYVEHSIQDMEANDPAMIQLKADLESERRASETEKIQLAREENKQEDLTAEINKKFELKEEYAVELRQLQQRQAKIEAIRQGMASQNDRIEQELGEIKKNIAAMRSFIDSFSNASLVAEGEAVKETEDSEIPEQRIDEQLETPFVPVITKWTSRNEGEQSAAAFELRPQQSTGGFVLDKIGVKTN
jgi:chromosome segregation ATPase